MEKDNQPILPYQSAARWICFLLSLVLSCVLARRLGWWAFPVGFVCVYASFTAIVVAYVMSAYNNLLPIAWQRPVYEHWKQQIKKRGIHPLVDLSLAMYIDMHLDGEFERGGIVGAVRALDGWMKALSDRVDSAFRDLVVRSEGVDHGNR